MPPQMEPQWRLHKAGRRLNKKAPRRQKKVRDKKMLLNKKVITPQEGPQQDGAAVAAPQDGGGAQQDVAAVASPQNGGAAQDP